MRNKTVRKVDTSPWKLKLQFHSALAHSPFDIQDIDNSISRSVSGLLLRQQISLLSI